MDGLSGGEWGGGEWGGGVVDVVGGRDQVNYCPQGFN